MKVISKISIKVRAEIDGCGYWFNIQEGHVFTLLKKNGYEYIIEVHSRRIRVSALDFEIVNEDDKMDPNKTKIIIECLKLLKKWRDEFDTPRRPFVETIAFLQNMETLYSKSL